MKKQDVGPSGLIVVDPHDHCWHQAIDDLAEGGFSDYCCFCLLGSYHDQLSWVEE